MGHWPCVILTLFLGTCFQAGVARVGWEKKSSVVIVETGEYSTEETELLFDISFEAPTGEVPPLLQSALAARPPLH
ncbi:hypothetical protein UPYG_G00098240 [Umbra pygmaea]|uniref:Uncharacterized protein n=1 Tax=Umbra pygmaea TaxID=75934 RepID=A0ABD0X0H9_UMBPY